MQLRINEHATNRLSETQSLFRIYLRPFSRSNVQAAARAAPIYLGQPRFGLPALARLLRVREARGR